MPPLSRRLLLQAGPASSASPRYSYILLPQATKWRTAELALDAGIRLLANTATVQAVRSGGSRGATHTASFSLR